MSRISNQFLEIGLALLLITFLSSCAKWSSVYSEGNIYHSVNNVEKVGPLNSIGQISSGTSQVNAWVAKIREYGAVQWAKSFMGGARKMVVKPTSDGGFIAIGTFEVQGGDYDGLVVKLDDNGNIVWQYRYGGINDDFFNDVVELQEGGSGYIVGGYTSSFGANEDQDFGLLPTDAWILRLSANGDMVWQKRYAIPMTHSHEYAENIKAIRNNRFAVSGSSEGLYGWLMVIKANGDVEWIRNYIAYNRDNPMIHGYLHIQSLLPTHDDGFMLGLMLHNGTFWIDDGAMMKLRPDGDIEWVKSYFTDDSYYAVGEIIQNEDGNYVAVGSTDVFHDGLYNFNAWLVGVNSGGGVTWERSYDPYFGNGRTHANYLHSQIDKLWQWSEKRLVLGGTSTAPNSDISNMFIAKVGEHGELSSTCGLLNTPPVGVHEPRPLVTVEAGSMTVSNTTSHRVETALLIRGSELEDNICYVTNDSGRSEPGRPSNLSAFSYPQEIDACALRNVSRGEFTQARGQCVLSCPFCTFSSGVFIKEIPVELKNIYRNAGQLSKIHTSKGISYFSKKILTDIDASKNNRVISKSEKRNIVSLFGNKPVVSDTSRKLRHLNATLNQIELRLRMPRELTPVKLPAGNSTEMNMAGVATLTFNQVKTGGKIGLAINNGMPASVAGYKAGWPVVTYSFNVDGAIKIQGDIRLGIYIGAISFSGKISYLRILEWDGTAYKDITTSVDFKNAYIYGKTDKLRQYVVVATI